MAKKHFFDQSLFSRIKDSYIGLDKAPNVYSLREQYRMHPDIVNFPNQYFYKNTLKTHVSAIDTNVKLNAYNVFSLDFTQTKGLNLFNYHNIDEANFVIDVLKVLRKYMDPNKYTYGLITPYAGQKEQIETRLRQESFPLKLYPVNTIDSYQGQEKDIIIASCARTYGTGFLSDPSRLNVALTRAKKCLILCANFSSLKVIIHEMNQYWNELVDHFDGCLSLQGVPVWSQLIDNAKKRNCFYERALAEPNEEFIERRLLKRS